MANKLRLKHWTTPTADLFFNVFALKTQQHKLGKPKDKKYSWSPYRK